MGEETLQQLAVERGRQVATRLYGQGINAETYAICKADLLPTGEGEAANNIVVRPEHSTLSNDAFPSHGSDSMLSNPPYGKSWKTDLERMGGKEGIKDPRFIIEHAGHAQYSLFTRSSDSASAMSMDEKKDSVGAVTHVAILQAVRGAREGLPDHVPSSRTVGMAVVGALLTLCGAVLALYWWRYQQGTKTLTIIAPQINDFQAAELKLAIQKNAHANVGPWLSSFLKGRRL